MRGNRLEKSGDQSGQKGTSSEVPGSHSELRETSLSGGKFLAALSYLENQDWSDRSPFTLFFFFFFYHLLLMSLAWFSPVVGGAKGLATLEQC